MRLRGQVATVSALHGAPPLVGSEQGAGRECRCCMRFAGGPLRQFQMVGGDLGPSIGVQILSITPSRKRVRRRAAQPTLQRQHGRQVEPPPVLRGGTYGATVRKVLGTASAILCHSTTRAPRAARAAGRGGKGLGPAFPVSGSPIAPHPCRPLSQRGAMAKVANLGPKLKSS